MVFKMPLLGTIKISINNFSFILFSGKEKIPLEGIFLFVCEILILTLVDLSYTFELFLW